MFSLALYWRWTSAAAAAVPGAVCLAVEAVNAVAIAATPAFVVDVAAARAHECD